MLASFFFSLLEMKDPPDYIFLPHFKAVPGEANSESSSQSQVCPLVQGETFYLQTTFRNKIDHLKIRPKGFDQTQSKPPNLLNRRYPPT